MSKFSEKFDIDRKTVGLDSPVYIIAEAGVSHFGNEEKAYELVDLALNSGADAVKFQIFDIDAMYAAESVEWKKRLGPRQLPYKAFERIQKYCYEKEITFFATAHDEPSLDFLISLDVPVYKIGSGEVGNWSYFKRIAELKKPVIFSTGMYKYNQIGEALDIFSELKNHSVAVLHCITAYPTPIEDVCLGNIKSIKDKYKVITGYSDHTEGFHIPLASVAMGAKIIEKHITLDYNIPNAQDWKVSCGPDNLSDFITQIRDIEAALSKTRNGPTDYEEKNLDWAGKSLVAKHKINKGRRISLDDLVSKRPGNGLSPSLINEVIGKRTKVTIQRDVLISLEYLE